MAEKNVNPKYFKDFESEEKYCGWVNKQVTDHPVVTQHHGHWKELIAWELGNQFALWNETKRSMVPVQLLVRKKRVVINLMKPLNETIEGKLNFFHHVIGVPNSGETKDIFGSQVATKLLDFNDYVNNMEELMEDMKHDLLRPGISCMKWIWDTDASGFIPKRKDGDVVSLVSQDGEVIGEVVPIFNIRPDPVAKTREKCRWIIEVKEVTAQELMKKFKLKEADLEDFEEGKDKYKGMHEIEEEKDKEEETYILKEHWGRPNDLFPDGRLIQSCAGNVLWTGDNPSPDGDLPHFFFFYKKSAYSIWSKGPLHFVQDIQREFNRMISMISEHIEAWRPKMSVGKGALKRANSMTVDNFEIVEVDYTRGEPKSMNMPEISQQVMAFRDFLVSSVDRVSNIHEVSYSRLPQYASRAPASLYSMMLEQENIKLDPMMKRINKTLLDMARFRLKLIDKHYSQDRMTKVIGKNREATIEYFSKSDLNENFDVRLEVGVSLNKSTTIQNRLLLELWREGIFTEKDRPKIISLLNLGTAEHELRSDAVDIERLTRENQAFLDDTYDKPREEGGVFVWIHDDHAVHINGHSDLGKSEEAQKWDEKKWKFFEAHITKHVVMLVKLSPKAPGPEAGAEELPLEEEEAGGAPGPLEQEGSMGDTIEGFGGEGGETGM